MYEQYFQVLGQNYLTKLILFFVKLLADSNGKKLDSYYHYPP